MIAITPSDVEEVEAVQQEGEVGGGLGGEAVALEAHVVGHALAGVPAVAEGRIGDDGVEAGLLAHIEAGPGGFELGDACIRDLGVAELQLR
jgi:hypothetical protein